MTRSTRPPKATPSLMAVAGSKGPVIRPEPWLRPEQAAEHLGIGLSALQRLKRAGLPHHKMDRNNGLALYLASEIDQWRGSHPRLPTTPPLARPRRPRYRPRLPASD